jgi:hypothetical protein
MKALAEKAMAQIDEADLLWEPAPRVNSVAVQVQHLHGNMLSRWTDFLTTDGEKPTRERDAEFIPDASWTREELTAVWEEGWQCLFSALDALAPDDLLKQVTIRGEAMSALDAIERQMSHYAYHVGQIVYIGKIRKGKDWKYLSIPPGESRKYQPSGRD